eukprot:7300179-Alexandrium_andersonii.AAC.1
MAIVVRRALPAMPREGNPREIFQRGARPRGQATRPNTSEQASSGTQGGHAESSRNKAHPQTPLNAA